MSEKNEKHWALRVMPALIFTVGVIMASIGGIMTLSSGTKLALFDHGPYGQVTRDQCEYGQDFRPIPLSVENMKPLNFEGEIVQKKPTEIEIVECLKVKKREEKERFQQRKKQDLIDGISALIIGLILMVFFRKSIK